MHHRALTALSLLAAAACAGGERAVTDTTATRDSGGARPAGATADAAAAAPARVASYASARGADGASVAFATPEAVRYDEALDGYFVSNINGNPSAKDGNGFIAFVPAEGNGDSARVVVMGGKAGATLHGPKGMAIVGDTLWVADIDAVRGFDKRTGRAVGTVSFAASGAKFLNDIAVGPDGALYITDTGIAFGGDGSMTHPGPDRVFKVAGRTGSVAVTFASLTGPNGITWDAGASRFVIANFAGSTLVTWKPGDAQVAPFVTGVGQFDGIERLADGRFLVSTWTDSSLYTFPATGGAATRLVRGVNAPADIGVDTRRNRVLVPLFSDNRVEAYQLR